MDLSYLDFDRVEVRTGRRGASVRFGARDAAPGIERLLGEGSHHFGEAVALSSAYLYVPSRGAAEEVRAALVRAIQLRFLKVDPRWTRCAQTRTSPTS